ncbi:hypothetical protein COS66_02170 [Candidatus Berkelbacteria bacterium CG06_land_8_20_14_3_00_43_10]|uniref:DUF721 domain-containing protein n=1 Tax=Candidatus Berkelbacteria bacterium CG10_big_fil_rev_8_21_14_0_10_43_14 TaxID=1974515 RepID=A0A2M6R9E7_9BACT|nr:MAG: hypothetical protein AUK41_01575 [Candidatus Berkelbacteria bacterium CG2_30_43_20]PIS07116.1 MAG: hypothetical protein COT79_00900 [Candidatus Berkelbacteria bacterium CG10_big_fil_rev_8_21_14_0_10_43_14]PIU87213.1 MAG: hypothetical protein COS66_02170 [Candidatus Berkelbacteria bacterium CG06_land_8_20_14_3_00_43_10]
MSFTSLTSIFAHKAHQRAIGAAQIVYEAQKVVGGDGQVLTFKNGNLRLSVKSSVAANQIKINQTALIEKINQELGRALVKKIYFRVGS